MYPAIGELREFLEQGIISPERMRVVEQNAIGLGVSSLQMMEAAGRSLAASVLTYNPGKVLILCGKGNNGADGMVAARYLQSLLPDVCYLDEPGCSPECRIQLSLLRHSSVRLHPFRCIEDLRNARGLFDEALVIVDSLLGTGMAGLVREPLATAVQMANDSAAIIISADVPTPGIRAGRICAFHRPKVPGSEIADVGIPVEAECCTGPGELTLVRAKSHEAYKGAGGEVLIVGGGPYQGAPYLAGLGALRGGADIVRIASPVFEPVPDLIYERLPGDCITEEHIGRILRWMQRADVVVCGNGLGDRSHAVVLAIAHAAHKVVFDADALRLPLPISPDAIYTPHAGEFERMTGIKAAADLAARGRQVRSAASGRVILLKGAVDVISDGNRVRFNRTGTPAMTVGGTGDVLAGLTGALFCRLPAFEAACIAAYVNGRAGMAAASHRESGLLASDMLPLIPEELFGRGA
jgi:NAD(P)H-hydrate epimerase